MAFSGKEAWHCHCRFCSTKMLKNIILLSPYRQHSINFLNPTHSAVVLRLGDGSTRSECLGSLDTGAGSWPESGENISLTLLPPNDRLLDEDTLSVCLRVNIRNLLAGEYQGILRNCTHIIYDHSFIKLFLKFLPYSR